MSKPWPKPGVSTAVFRGESVLLVKRAKPPLAGLWSLPGGHVEAGETAKAAALRELAEETGVSAEIGDVADVLDVILREGSDLTAHYVITVFSGRWLSGEPVAGSDVSAARFVALAEVDSYPLTKGASGTIARAKRLHDGEVPA